MKISRRPAIILTILILSASQGIAEEQVFVHSFERRHLTDRFFSEGASCADSKAAHGYGLSWFENDREGDTITFREHKIMGATAAENDYGVVFSQLTVGDLNGDEWPDVVVGNKKGTFALIHHVKPVDHEAWRRAQPIPTNPQLKEEPSKASAPDNGFQHSGLSPEDAAAAMTVPAGFSVQAFAGEPDVKQPIAMTIDDWGRIWVAEAFEYPRRAPDGEGHDRILIFEDSDGDCQFDKRTVFAEGLNLVSGLEVGFGGVWVGAAPYFMFIPDRDLDDVPDSEPQILLDGWRYDDTHETLNAFLWGPDGQVYFIDWYDMQQCHRADPSAHDRANGRIFRIAYNHQPPVHVDLQKQSDLELVELQLNENDWYVRHALLSHGEDAADHNLPLMVWYALEPLLQQDMEFAFDIAQRGKIPIVLEYTVRRAAELGSDEAVAMLVGALATSNDVTEQATFLKAMSEAWQGVRRLDMPQGWPAVYAKLSHSKSDSVSAPARRLSVKFGDPQALVATQAILTDTTANLEERKSALQSLLGAKAPELAPILQTLILEKGLRPEVLRGLAAYVDAKTPSVVLDNYDSFSADERFDALSTLASRAEYAGKLLDAIVAKRIAASDLSADLVRQLGNLRDEAIVLPRDEIEQSSLSQTSRQ